MVDKLIAWFILTPLIMIGLAIVFAFIYIIIGVSLIIGLVCVAVSIIRGDDIFDITNHDDDLTHHN